MGDISKSGLNVISQDAVAIPRQTVSYGVASGVTLRPVHAVGSESLTLAEQVNFFFSEYFKGLAFVVLTSILIFVVPLAIIKGGRPVTMLFNIVKRFTDIVGAIVGLVLTIPLWIVVPVIVKLDSPGPVFYSQTRVGINRRRRQRRAYQKVGVDENRHRERRRTDYLGRPFKVYKFRTMVNNAEKNSGPVWAADKDPRITRIGRFLRKTRIDEIPQFWNVLKGDMSLVGPRPERPSFVIDLSTKVKGYANRLDVKPGLTGLAQVENGYDSSLSSVVQKVRYDLEYIEKRSIWTDFKILLKTVVVVVTGKGAY